MKGSEGRVEVDELFREIVNAAAWPRSRDYFGSYKLPLSNRFIESTAMDDNKAASKTKTVEV